MGSMRDQTGELAMQMKEAVEKYESMEEELTEAHKLLSERSREAETMRRLLSEVEDRNGARTRDMKERMEAAFDERDKAEEEAATIGRRRAREIEELRDRVRESERNLKHAEESQTAAERELNGLRDGKSRAEEALERIKGEYEDTKKAMISMQDALDQTDNQMEEIECQRAEMRKTLQEEQARSEKLQKSYKALQEEYRQLQIIRPKGIDNNTRSSIDSARSGRASPSSAHANTPGNQMVNMDYLKNVLLQFLEQKDKKTQLQLVPVLGMLLKFDKKDEQKWLAVVSAK
jgi:chromosome segregation ATPase